MPWIRYEDPPPNIGEPQSVRDACDALYQARAEIEALNEPEAQAEP